MNTQHFYYQTLTWESYLQSIFRDDTSRFLTTLRQAMGEEHILLTSSGRVCIPLTLKAAHLTRRNEVFVPPYLNECILAPMLKYGFPVQQLTPQTKAVLLYHHWGFLQDFRALKKIQRQKKLLVIEDCAHGFWGKLDGIRMGEFGDTALFSLSKLFPVTYAGAIRINTPALRESISSDLSYPVSWVEWWETVKGEWTYLNYYHKLDRTYYHRALQTELNKWYVTLNTYPQCKRVKGIVPTSTQHLKSLFDRQHHHFLMLLEAFKVDSFMLPGDEMNEIAPLCYPFLSEDQTLLEKVNRWFVDHQIYTGVYQFDINRNMFNPNYQSCVPIPLYSTIDTEILKLFIKTFK